MSTLTDHQVAVEWRVYMEHVGVRDAWCAACSHRGPCQRRKAARRALIDAGQLVDDQP